MSEYPKCKYHKTEPACIVQDKAEEEALGAGWFNHPNDVNKPEPVKEPAVKVEPPKGKKEE